MTELVEKRMVKDLISGRFSCPKTMLDELDSFPIPQAVSIDKLDIDARETLSHIVECYEEKWFSKEERVMLAGLAFQAMLRHKTKEYEEGESHEDDAGRC